VKVFEISSTQFHTNYVQDTMVRYAKRKIVLLFGIEMAVMSVF